MDFNKPICAVVEGDDESKKLREYFVEHEIAFRVIIEGYVYVGDLHIFECSMTDEIFQAADRDTDALFYQWD